MTTFDDRNKKHENKFAHDEELAFKANARRNKLLGLWAAEKMGVHGTNAEEYAREVALADFEHSGDDDVLNKVLKDLTNHGVAITVSEVRIEMERLMNLARKQLKGEG